MKANSPFACVPTRKETGADPIVRHYIKRWAIVRQSVWNRTTLPLLSVDRRPTLRRTAEPERSGELAWGPSRRLGRHDHENVLILVQPASSLVTEARGVAVVEHLTLNELSWIWRRQLEADYGIDAHVEIVEQDRVTGQLLALQIKSGPSFFKEWDEDQHAWTFRSDNKHLEYWLNHVLPVIVVISDPVAGTAYWQVVTSHTIRRTSAGFSLPIPISQSFTAASRQALIEAAGRRAETALARLDYNLRLLPGDCSTPLVTAREKDSVGAALLADMLAEGRFSPEMTIGAILNAEPSWLARSTTVSLLWAALGGYANEYDLYAPAAEAFLRAASAGGDASARLLAVAGVLLTAAGKTEQARAILNRALNDGARILSLVGLALLDAPKDSALPIPVPSEIEHADPETLATEPIVLAFVADQKARADDADAAIDLFEVAVGVSPRGTKLKVALVRLLARRHAIAGSRAGVDMRRARELAESALLDRRQWAGPSWVPLGLLLDLSGIQGNATAVIAGASAEPLGTATAAEAAHPEIAGKGALAALQLDRQGDLSRFLEIVGEHPTRFMIAALQSDLRDDRAASIVAWRIALEAAVDDSARSQCVSSLARLGDWPSSQGEDLHAKGVINSQYYELLDASAQAVTNTDLAVVRLRALAENVHLAALRLVQVLDDAGRMSEAIGECENQFRRWQSNAFLVKWSDLLRRDGRESTAVALIETTLDRPDASPDVRHSHRRWLVSFFGHQGNWSRVADIASAALAERPEDEDVGWSYLIALANLRRIPEARQAQELYDLHPLERDEIRLWAQLHLGEPWSEAHMLEALELATTHADDRLLAATLIGVALREALATGSKASEPTINKLRAAEAEIVEPGAVARLPDDPDELEALLKGNLKDRAERAERIIQRVRDGEISMGRLASGLGRSYAETLLLNGAGFIPAVDLETVDDEADLAMKHLHGTWAVDTSAFVVSLFLGPTGGLLRGLASSMISSFAAADDALRARDAIRAAISAPFVLRYLAESGEFARVELPPEQRSILRVQAADLERLVQNCELYRVVAKQPGLGPLDDPWASTMQIANERTLPLYCDDVVTRREARFQGIDTFGTFALLRAATSLGLLASTPSRIQPAMPDSIQILLSKSVVDLPVDPEAILAQGLLDMWEFGPATTVIGRTAWWAQSDRAPLTDWQTISDSVAFGGEGALVRWIRAALAGALPTIRVDGKADYAIRIVGAGFASGYLAGLGDLRAALSKIVGTSFLASITDLEIKVFVAVKDALAGRIADPGSGAAAAIGAPIISA
jgi:tetratricopeptide (TPR) repeat protein